MEAIGVGGHQMRREAGGDLAESGALVRREDDWRQGDRR